jgi:hypothetical protein
MVFLMAGQAAEVKNAPPTAVRQPTDEIPNATWELDRKADSGDIPDAISNPPASSQELPPADQTPSTPPKVPRAKNQATELVAEALTLPTGGTVAGQPWPLSQAIAATPDRKQQLVIIHNYWQLAEAVAKYRFAFDQSQEIEQLQARPADEASLKAARAAASATLREAELTVLSAQNDFAALVGLSAESPLPLPADKPHVGGYRTNFQSQFARTAPPPIARTIDRTLPIRCAAIEDRASATNAARDAFLAAEEAYQAGQTDFSNVGFAAEKLLHERRAMIETVCRYNHDIAEYAAAVIAPNVSAEQLLSTLLETGRGTIEPRAISRPGEIQPVEYLQPITGQTGLTPSRPNQPTPAVRPKTRPTPASPDTRPTPLKEEPNLSPVPNEATNETEAEIVPLLERSSQKPLGQQQRTTRKIISEENNASAALYSALCDAAPAVRAKELTLALHWDRSLPENSAKPMSLAECLARDAAGNRRETIAAFWLSRQRAAEYQAIAQELEFLDNLSAGAFERRGNPTGAVDMLHLRCARLSAKAALEEAQAALVESQFELALRTQSTADKVWPLASTPPHCGSYDLNLAAQPRQVVGSRPMLKLSKSIPLLGECVRDRATAVVEADAARARMIETYLSGAKPLCSILAAVENQTEQTTIYLQTLTSYNCSIADFALSVLPSTTPSDKLAAALVVQP